jgi:hypothetical protein
MTGVHVIAIVMLTAMSVWTSPAQSDDYPTLNVAPLCHGITNQSTLQEGLRNVTFDECIKAEQGDREMMIKEWSTFSSDDKSHCVAEATMGGESSYTDLLTCLEMARDVRGLRVQADAQPQQDQPKQQRKSSHRNSTSR